jgi:hypothetical protein
VKDDPRIVIIGADPTGPGAGYRLQELGDESPEIPGTVWIPSGE